MKEKESRQENITDNRKKIIMVSLIILIILIILLLIIFNRKNKYDITFETNGGSLIETLSVDENGIITKPEDPVRENYEFAGWYYNDELYDFSKPVTSDMKLEARWVAINRVSGIKLNNVEITLYIGDKAKLVATITPENAKNKNITWKSSDSSVVSVDAEGNIKGLKEGTATITVTTEDGEFTAKAQVTVKKTETVTNEVTNNKDNSNSGTTNNGNTSGGNHNTGTTDKENNGNTETTNPTPTPTVVNVTGITLDKTTLTLTEGGNSKLTATVNPSNADNKKVTWVSSNTAVATVDANGNVTAIKAGTATITVTTVDGGFKATCQVTVNEKPASYSVTLTEQPLELGGSIQYNVTVKKNGDTFNGWKVVVFNTGARYFPTSGTISSIEYKDITSATIKLEDGSSVTATVNK